MKGRKGKTSDFRVPLTPEALHVIELASQQQRDGHIFPGVKRGVISDASMARLMERRGLEARPHGFRSTLRVWLTESQQASREVAETIIAHQTGSLTERAYNRTDFLEQRRELMEAWERYLKSGDQSQTTYSIARSIIRPLGFPISTLRSINNLKNSVHLILLCIEG